jgi:hypothetical protein
MDQHFATRKCPFSGVFVAEQLGLDAAHFGDYAERDQTRREHVLEIETALGLRPK